MTVISIAPCQCPILPLPWFLIFSGMSATAVFRQVLFQLNYLRVMVDAFFFLASWLVRQEYRRLCHSVRSVSLRLSSACRLQSVFFLSKFFQVTRRSFHFPHSRRSPKYSRRTRLHPTTLRTGSPKVKTQTVCRVLTKSRRNRIQSSSIETLSTLTR